MTLEEDIHSVGYHELVYGHVPAGSHLVEFPVSVPIVAISAPFISARGQYTPASLSAIMVSEYEFMSCCTGLQGVFQPVILCFTERPFPVFGFFIDIAVPVNIENDKKCISPGECVIVFGQSDIPGLRRLVSAVETIGYRIRIVKLPPQGAVNGNIFRWGLIQPVATLSLVISQTEQERHGVTYLSEVLPVVQMQRTHIFAGSFQWCVVVAECITEREHEICRVPGLILQAYLVQAPEALFVVQVFVGFNDKSE